MIRIDRRFTVAALACGALLLAPPDRLAAQEEEGRTPQNEEPWAGLPDPPPQVDPPPLPGSGPVVAMPGAEYANDGLWRFLMGRGNRELWATPHVIPVLDLGSFAGGLEPEKRGGTSQSITLHMFGADGRQYIFRSVNKWAHQGLPHDLRLTPAGDLIKDQTGSLHPGGAFVVPPLLEAAGILHVSPTLYVMPDDARLGQWRDTFAGMVGILEENPNEGPNNEPLFAGAERVAGMDRVLEHLEEDPGHRANARTYLKARLVDLLVGDPDRGFDNWRWARYGDEGRYLWEPVPRDRDWAFIRSDGLLPSIARTIYPKLVDFGAGVDVTALTRASQGQDRILLSELSRPVWDSVALALRDELTDEVIREAARSLPPEEAALDANELERLLRVRRDQLPDLAAEWYGRIAGEVDVRATDGPDRAEIERMDDGTLRVTLLWPVDARGRALVADDDEEEEEDGGEGDEAPDAGGVVRDDGQDRDAEAEAREAAAGREDERAARRAAPDTTWAPYFTRRFLPEETGEVRVYLHGGGDRAVVRGSGPAAIRVRVIGGGGDDHLVDTSAGARVTFHDARGENRLETAPRTAVDTRRWEDPEPFGWIAEKVMDENLQDWGGSGGWSPMIGYTDVAGPVVGVAHTSTRYGFRQAPWSRQFRIGAMVGLTGGGAELQASLDQRRPNSPVRFSASARASSLEALRFHGFGNETPLGSDAGLQQVRERLVLLRAAVHRDWGAPGRPVASLSLGPEVRWSDPDEPDGSALDRLRPRGVGGFGQVGLRAGASIDRSRGGARPSGGFALEGGAGVFPSVWDADEAFGDAHVAARTWLALADPVTLALRGGAERVWGGFPVQEAAFLGGRESLRGFRYRRFAGDAAVHGTGELRVELAEVTLLTRGRVGVTGLTDVGRVWMDGVSEGPWHVGYGMGVWFESLDAVLRLTWARGEEDRIYAGLGMSF